MMFWSFTDCGHFLVTFYIPILTWTCFLVTMQTNEGVIILSKFQRLDDVKHPVQAYETPSNEPSVMQCTTKCNINVQCRTVSYNGITGECWTSNNMWGKDSLLSAKNWTMVYKADGCLKSSCYKVVDIELSWNDAKVYCENTGGHLADVTSKEEMEFIETVVSNNRVFGGCFIGGFDYGNTAHREFRWSDGSLIADHYTNWARGEPNYLKEKCIMLSIPSLQWNDIQCVRVMKAVCEYD